MSSEDGLANKLDLLIGLFRVAYREPLDALRAEIDADSVKSAIRTATTSDWTPSGDLQREVAKKTGVSTKTVQRAAAELVSTNLLVVRDSGRSTAAYRWAGVV